jgi:hypothetical protein
MPRRSSDSQIAVALNTNLATQCLTRLTGVGLQQDACFHQLLRRMLASADQTIELLALCRAELHDILLYGDRLGGLESTP